MCFNGNNVLDAQTRTAAFPASIRYFGASREHVIAFGAFIHITIQLASSCAIAEWLILRLHAAKVRRCANPAKTPISIFALLTRHLASCAQVLAAKAMRAHDALSHASKRAHCRSAIAMQCRRCAARATTVAAGAPLRGAECRCVWTNIRGELAVSRCVLRACRAFVPRHASPRRATPVRAKCVCTGK